MMNLMDTFSYENQYTGQLITIATSVFLSYLRYLPLLMNQMIQNVDIRSSLHYENEQFGMNAGFKLLYEMRTGNLTQFLLFACWRV